MMVITRETDCKELLEFLWEEYVDFLEEFESIEEEEYKCYQSTLQEFDGKKVIDSIELLKNLDFAEPPIDMLRDIYWYGDLEIRKRCLEGINENEREKLAMDVCSRMDSITIDEINLFDDNFLLGILKNYSRTFSMPHSVCREIARRIVESDDKNVVFEVWQNCSSDSHIITHEIIKQIDDVERLIEILKRCHSDLAGYDQRKIMDTIMEKTNNEELKLKAINLVRECLPEERLYSYAEWYLKRISEGMSEAGKNEVLRPYRIKEYKERFGESKEPRVEVIERYLKEIEDLIENILRDLQVKEGRESKYNLAGKTVTIGNGLERGCQFFISGEGIDIEVYGRDDTRDEESSTWARQVCIGSREGTPLLAFGYSCTEKSGPYTYDETQPTGIPYLIVKTVDALEIERGKAFGEGILFNKQGLNFFKGYGYGLLTIARPFFKKIAMGEKGDILEKYESGFPETLSVLLRELEEATKLPGNEKICDVFEEWKGLYKYEHTAEKIGEDLLGIPEIDPNKALKGFIGDDRRGAGSDHEEH